jgi:tetratricopeptide (TPR) repeat protein
MLAITRRISKLSVLKPESHSVRPSRPSKPLFNPSEYSNTQISGIKRLGSLYLKRQFCSPPSSSSGTSRIGNVFDLTPEQYEELKNPGMPRDFEYKTYTSPPTGLEEEPIFEPKTLDLHAVTELMVRKRYPAAIKKALAILEPHLQVIRAGFPSHNPNLNAELRHELSECLTLLSLCYMHQGEMDPAIDAATSAALLTPTADKFSDVANHLLEAGRLEEAIVAAERAIELDPHEEVDALVTKASALWRLKRLEGHDILALCDLALARDPYVITALEIKAEYLLHHGKLNDALKVIDRAIAKDNDNFHIISIKTRILEQMDRLPLALTTVLNFFKEEPESIEAHREAARIALLLKDWSTAHQHLKFVNEHLDEGFADRAYALLHDGILDEAQTSLELAITKNDTQSIAFGKAYSHPTLKRSLTMKLKKHTVDDASNKL